MKFQNTLYATAMVATVLACNPTLAQPTTRLHIGLVIQDTCEIRAAMSVANTAADAPRVSCALKHPHRLIHQHPDNADQSRTNPLVHSRRPAAAAVWLVEF